MDDLRLNILSEARNILEKESGSHSERESLVRLLDILTASLEKLSPGDDVSIEAITRFD
jgi:hypothetical protein